MTAIEIAVAGIIVGASALFWPRQNSSATKAERARRYVGWLSRVYGDEMSLQEAARHRRTALAPHISYKPKYVRQEIELCDLVIEGWHEWNGAKL